MNNKTIFLSAACSILPLAIMGKKQISDTRKLFPPKTKIYQKGWIDFNKNGKKDIYEDPSQSIEKRIDDLLSQMTLEEKSCQLSTY